MKIMRFNLTANVDSITQPGFSPDIALNDLITVNADILDVPDAFSDPAIGGYFGAFNGIFQTGGVTLGGIGPIIIRDKPADGSLGGGDVLTLFIDPSLLSGDTGNYEPTDANITMVFPPDTFSSDALSELVNINGLTPSSFNITQVFANSAQGTTLIVNALQPLTAPSVQTVPEPGAFVTAALLGGAILLAKFTGRSKRSTQETASRSLPS